LNTPTFIYPVLAVLLAYLLGSLSFAVIVSRVMGLNDPRTYGSKNPGATNVLRSGSRKAAVATLLLDAVKGWLPVALVRWWGPALGLEDGTLAMVGLAAFLGHLFPVFFRFVGGKGVATALGVLVGVSPWLGLATGAVWLFVMGDGTLWAADRYGVLSLVLMSALLVWRHAANIDRLLKGAESRLGKKK
jgi:acyl phosphate:glycerol-3-phosphate acyltransferase